MNKETLRLIEKYEREKIANTNKLTLRGGYYMILSVEVVVRPNTKDFIKAKTIYSDNISFNDFIEREINISPLYNKNSRGNQTIGYEQLVDNIIEIAFVDLVNGSYNGKPSKWFEVYWKFIGSNVGLKERYYESRRLHDDAIKLIIDEDEFQAYLEEELSDIFELEEALTEEEQGLLYDEHIKINYDETDGFLNDKLTYTESEYDGLGMEYDKVDSDDL